MAKVKESRFALLRVEDDSDEETNEIKAKKTEHQNRSAQKKSKNKKKKGSQNLAETDELKHMAFGQSSRQRVQSGGSDQGDSQSVAREAQWNQWQKLDAEYTADTFEKDLQQALLLSRLENEQEKLRKKEQNSSLMNGHDGSGDQKDTKKKKKKDKQNTMSLEQFNKQIEEKKTHSDELEPLPQSPVSRVPLPSEDERFFDAVESDVSRIIRQEKMQEEYKKQYAAESVITAKYQEQVKKKDKEIEFLRATMKKQEEEVKQIKEELKQVKKRNKQLCVILAQGEMKDKAEVLMQVDQLTEVKDELTEQVTELTAELEKERSKVHSMKAELDKVKSGKHK